MFLMLVFYVFLCATSCLINDDDDDDDDLEAPLSKFLTYYVFRSTQPPTLSGTGNEQ